MINKCHRTRTSNLTFIAKNFCADKREQNKERGARNGIPPILTFPFSLSPRSLLRRKFCLKHRILIAEKGRKMTRFPWKQTFVECNFSCSLSFLPSLTFFRVIESHLVLILILEQNRTALFLTFLPAQKERRKERTVTCVVHHKIT